MTTPLLVKERVLLGDTYCAIFLRLQTCSKRLIPNHEGDFMHQCLRIFGPCLRRSELRELGLETRVRRNVCVLGNTGRRHGY